MSRDEQQRDAPTDRLSHHDGILDLEGLEKSGHTRDEEHRCIRGPRDVRIAVARIVERVHAKPLREGRYDPLKHVELGTERMQQHECRSLPHRDVAQARAADRDVANRDLRRP